MLQCSYTLGMTPTLRKYDFIVAPARSLKECPTVHLVTCATAHRIKRPVRVFRSEGLNANEALETHTRKWQGLFSVTKPCYHCLGGDKR